MSDHGGRPSDTGLAPAPHLQVQLIGRFALSEMSGEPIIVRSRRARGLLAYLYFQPRQSEGREKLCDLFWGDRGEPQARASLRQCLSELRANLPQASRCCLVVERDSVRLEPTGLAVDVGAIRAAIRQAQPQALSLLVQEAGASRLLEDVEMSGLFAEWLGMTRVQFDRELAQGVRKLIKQSEAREDWEAVRQLGEAYLVRDCLDEIVVAALIRADAAVGDRPSARRRLAELRAALGKAYGVEPGADTLAALSLVAAPGRDAADAKGGLGIPHPKPARADLPLVMVADFDSSHLDESGRPLGGVIKGEVIAGLSGFREFYVSSAPVSVSQGDREDWLRRGASYVIGGALWRSAGGVRLTAQLIRASDQQVIWSERLEISYPQITEAVDRIITKIIGAVSPIIDADLQVIRSAGLSAQYARYVAARSAAAAPADFDAASRAAAELEALITDDPGFILPYLPLARLYNNDFACTRPLSSGPAERRRAFELARAALSQDRSHIHAYTVVGWCHLRQGQWDAARTHFEQALSLNPFHADRVMEAGCGYLFLGEIERAGELLHRCLLLNPAPKDIYYTDLANLELVRGDHESSLRFLDLVAEPTTWGLLYRAMNATLLGRPDRSLSRAVLDRARRLWAPDLPFTPEAVLRWIGGDHPFASPEMRERFLENVRQTLF